MATRELSKHVLFDTCFLDKILGTAESVEKFTSDIFKNVKITACIHPLIYLEFIRKSRDKAEKDKISEFLKNQFIELPLTNDIFEITKTTYPLYSRCKKIENHKQVSVVDAINIGLMKKFGKSLQLITMDMNDYPFEMVRRVSGTKDIGENVITWAVFEFDENKFKELLENYNKHY